MPVLGNGAAWLSWLGLTRPTRFPGDPHETQKNLFFSVCVSVVNAQEVIPDFYKGPGVDPNRSYVNQGFSEHVDPFNGCKRLGAAP